MFSYISHRSVAKVALVAVALTVVASVASIGAGQSNTSASGNGTGTNGTSSAPVEGESIPASCQDIKENPDGSDVAPNYRRVRGTCTIRLEDGEILSNVWFQANGAQVQILARGSGWTIKHVALTNYGSSQDSAIKLQVNSRDGVGLVQNAYFENIDSNVIFVHPRHAGTIRFEGVTGLDVEEDFCYCSRPGNPRNSPVGGIDGESGIVGVNQAYLKDIGNRPNIAGYGLRMGSDGSYVTNSVVADVTGPALANTFAGGAHSRRMGGTTGVTFQNVDVMAQTGLRVNNHQGGLKGQRQWTAVTTLQNVRINAPQEIERNRAGGEDPIVRGSYTEGNARDVPPPKAPRSAVRAASGVGGGVGSIGGPVDSPGGSGTGVLVVVGNFAAILLLGGVLVIVCAGTVVIIFLEERGNGGSFL